MVWLLFVDDRYGVHHSHTHTCTKPAGHPPSHRLKVLPHPLSGRAGSSPRCLRHRGLFFARTGTRKGRPRWAGPASCEGNGLVAAAGPRCRPAEAHRLPHDHLLNLRGAARVGHNALALVVLDLAPQQPQLGVGGGG